MFEFQALLCMLRGGMERELQSKTKLRVNIIYFEFLALLCMLLGGMEKELPSGTKLRVDIIYF